MAKALDSSSGENPNAARGVESVVDMIAKHSGLRMLQDRVSGEADAAHGLGHLLRVAWWALRFAAGVDPNEVIAAALLHDLVNLPKDHPERALASEHSAEQAVPLLAQAGFGPSAQARICLAIRQHSFSRGEVPTQPLSCAIQDADRLEALGAIGVLRCAATGGRMNASMFHEQDPWAQHRELDDRAFSVDHFFTKLLRLADTMTTSGGRAEAHRRSAVLRRFLDDLGTELGMPRPD